MTTVPELARDLTLTGLGTRGLLPGAPLRHRARWDAVRAAGWADATGWLVGCNFVPSTASNQLELWQADTFDPSTIDRELGWAADLGMNSVRLFLHDLLWVVDGPAFLDRVDRVLDLAAGHGISVLPVLFDGIWDPEPRPGPQRAPRPGVHNSTWVQGPGAAVLADRSRWASLRPYVDAVLERFGSDPRVVAWDLFNEPDSPNPAYLRRDPRHKRRLVADLLETVWDWAVAADPAQPLTVGIYLAPASPHPERASRVARTALERSDVVSFHCYGPEPVLRRAIDGLAGLGRPLMCTEWMARPASPPSLLPVFRDTGVGCFTWGLVDGRSQTRYPWSSWVRRGTDRTTWFHDLLHADGSPYDPEEVRAFRTTAASIPAPEDAPMSAFDAEYEPSPWEPIAEEVALYERTGGSEPSNLVGEQWVILWTLGARSGKVRKTPLVRITNGGGRYAVIGSMGGAPTHPQWVHNLRAHPVARLQDGPDIREFSVREVEGAERDEWWARARAVWPEYDTYQASTERRIPVFVLEPAPHDVG